ncbi:MAG: energy-coupling factor transporter transmembrane protein EcfT [Lawsonibacter sp.]|jgi:energy-coupling factor transport system permease protein
MTDAFSRYHPAVNATWFALVLVGVVTSFHPALLLIALGCGLAWSIQLGLHWRPLSLFALFLLAAVCNPLFTHAGVTILCYFPNGNPLTLESILFGLGAGGMLLTAAVLLRCGGAVLTADKWMCLMGRALPILSLLLSMALRFFPQTQRRLTQTTTAQRQAGQQGHTPLARARQVVRQISALIFWSLEAALTTADSMESRGYGLPGRTAYTNYRLEHRDRNALGWLALLGGYLFLMALHGNLAWRYYPSLRWAPLDLWTVSALADWAVLCALPLYLNWKEDRAWTCFDSKT